jgi:acid phosphatase class B
MIRNFTVELAGTSFKFNTLSAKELKAFQVYVQQDGRQLRFHMQRGDEVFYITDRSICPAEYVALEAELSAAIFKSQDNTGI